MIPEIRQRYNAIFSEERYAEMLHELNTKYGKEVLFRIAETPVFVPLSLKNRLIEACESIIQTIQRPDFKQITERAVPENCAVPGEDAHTQFLAIDFAICKDEKGDFLPQLIELQGFPSLYCYQPLLASAYKKYFYAPDTVSNFFEGYTAENYYPLLKKVLCGNHPVENVILLEVEPEKQPTRIDFHATEEMTGVRAVSLTEVIKEGRKLYYLREGIKTPIHRIYNRVIFDELNQRTDLKLSYNLLEEVDVEWAGHPNWFFRISKYTMPFLKSPYIPECHFLHQLDTIPQDLENWVLKPLFSFSGAGVKIDVTPEDIEQIRDRENYMLQKKVKYEPVIKALDGEVKCEIRMLYLWEESAPKPELVTSLTRLSRGKMVGVKYNKDFDWVGGSVSFFEKG